MSNTADLYERLNKLSDKVGKPFIALLKSGQLDEGALQIILDAGELSGDTAKLLGFAVGYFSMRSRNFPVTDVIQMAKQQNRRINLAWSPNRWKDEHEKLSRVATMQVLSEAAVYYDLKEFEALLPERWAGYLIRSSKRLGMEGLRQRHCVAGYHDGIVKGNYAIGVVFQGAKRWTVQLHLSQNKESPIYIGQVRTRYNEMPSHKDLLEIHKALGVKPVERISLTKPEVVVSYMEALAQVLPVLREHGIQKVVVDFNGSCDSGAIDGVNFHPPLPAEIQDVTISKVHRTFDNGEWLSEKVTETVDIGTAIEQITNDYLDSTNVDWYNDDGGFGDLIIDVQEGTVELSISVRQTSSEVEFHEHRDILTGEEI